MYGDSGTASEWSNTMRRRETTLTQKGQVTIPREICSRLGLKPRDRVVVELEGRRCTQAG
jgi:AbrB family looped-hinge helix DNA binding protein